MALQKMIYIVEDDDSIREMIRMALSSFSYDVKGFSNAEDALSAISNAKPDMAIFDIMLPGISGLSAVKKLRMNPEYAALPIILLTAKDTELDKVTGLDCGADDYLTKPFGVMELGARIRSLFRRTEDTTSIDLNHEKITAGDLTINSNTREVLKSEEPIDLTFKEYELLYFLVKEHERIIPREELLSKIWGFDFAGETRTLDIHIRTLRQKLGDDADTPLYIKTIRNVGYRFIG